MTPTTSLTFTQLLAAAIALTFGLSFLGLWLQYRRETILAYTRAWLVLGAGSLLAAVAAPRLHEPGIARVVVMLAFLANIAGPLLFIDAALSATTAHGTRRVFWRVILPSLIVFEISAFALSSDVPFAARTLAVRLINSAVLAAATFVVWRAPAHAGRQSTLGAHALLLARLLTGLMEVVSPQAITVERQPLLFSMILFVTTLGAGFLLTVAFFTAEREETVRERLRLERERASAQRMDSLGRMAESVAHDFNNVLTAILASSELAALPDATDDDRQIAFRESTHAVERGKDLTRRLLAFASPLAVVETVYGPVQRLRELVPMLQRLAGAEVRLTLDTSRVDGIAVCEALGDPGQFDQLLLNLTANARDAMPREGQVRICCEVTDPRHGTPAERGTPNARQLLISIEDTGSGIPAAIKDRIFEPDFTTKEAGKSTGLGLASAYAFVQSCGGLLHVESTEGAGTTFTVRLPIRT